MTDSQKWKNSTGSSFSRAKTAARTKLAAIAVSTADLAGRASQSVKDFRMNASEQARVGFHKLDANHEQIADHADTVAKTARVAAGVAVAGAAVAAPTGLAAVGVAVGLVSAPLVVTAAPVLVAVAGGALTVSAAASLYSKARRRQKPKSDA
jgi:hypothetical protein